jgi:DNA-binding GntR family transcriptional regulator
VSAYEDLAHVPVEREVLSSQVKDRILTWILQGDLPPGSRLVETQLARQLGTSQAPVREALRDLASLGFIETRPYKGSWVRKPSKEELIEAVQVRAELEGLAARLAAERRSDSCVEELEVLLAEMGETAARGDAHDQAVKTTAFHARIVDAAGSGTLKRHWEMLEPFSRTYITTSGVGIDLGYLGSRHQGLLEAIRDRDPELAEARAKAHAEEVIQMLRDFEHPELEENEGAGPALIRGADPDESGRKSDQGPNGTT